MIGSGIHGAVVRPFYNRGKTGIGRTFLGKLGARDALGVPNLTIGPFALDGADTLLVALVYDQVTLGSADATTFNALPLTANNVKVGTGAAINYVTKIYSLPMAGVPASATIVADFTGGAVLPIRAAILAIKVSALRQAPPSNDQNKANAPAGAATTQDSTFTANSAQAKEFVWGIIGTNGIDTVDAVGVWAVPLVQGERTGAGGAFPSIDLKEGYYVASAISTFRARVTFAASRTYMALCSTYRGL